MGRPARAASALAALLCIAAVAALQVAGDTLRLAEISVDVLRAGSAPVSYGSEQAANGAAVPNQEPLVLRVVSVDEKSTVEIRVDASRDGTSFAPQQAFLRVSDLNQSDHLVVLPARSEKKTKLSFAVSPGKQPTTSSGGAAAPYWKHQHVYSFELLLGDTSTENAIVYQVISALRVDFRKPPPPLPTPGVFDFDMSVKKEPQPEFRWELPAPRSSPPMAIIAVFTVLAVLPMLGFVGASASVLGCFPLAIPKSGPALAAFAVFFACLTVIAGILFMFWLRWNILTTWKVLAVALIPTVISGQKVLYEVNMRKIHNARMSK
ncbi:Dolichyl-diphosphooligosaccharide--protein glycosyltransferase subunit 2 [Porphyridium purpureum]|uniref:Dolichyl-diphosphooligosaccharide--protein glycosyltransferase subunit 2 n=1 Tax=Porphyridium purpureum TaxID=35688 RepID=A0A5J4YHR6_PORPP|nr:Dolichyl-diphosphooligosaccharide--protein glycosyltransferase subunit 2 [Porphyridium purpureum]|eukprot:POR7179..scf289_17